MHAVISLSWKWDKSKVIKMRPLKKGVRDLFSLPLARQKRDSQFNSLVFRVLNWVIFSIALCYQVTEQEIGKEKCWQVIIPNDLSSFSI